MQRHSTADDRHPDFRIRHSPLPTRHLSLVTRHSSLDTPLSAICITVVAAFAATALADLDFGAFAHRATIDFDGYDGASTLTNFPAFVRLVEGTGGFSVSDCALPGGQDVRFSLGDGVELPSKVVAWDDHGTNEFYVLVPELTAATRILAFWGNATAEARDPFATPFAQDDYILSWSFEDDGNIALDGTLSSAYGLAANGPQHVAGAGVAGKAMSFNKASSQYVRLPSAAYYPLWTHQTFTYEGWAKWSAVPTGATGIFGLSRGAWNEGSFIILATSGKITMKDGIETAYVDKTSTIVPTLDTWHHLMMARDNATGVATLYIDGAQAATSTKAYTRTKGDYSFGAGQSRRTSYTTAFDGLVDEVRVSPVCRGADYAAAVYKNVTDAAGFMTIADASATPYVETIGLAAPETVSITVAAGTGGTVSPALSGSAAAKGSVVEVTATPADDTKAFYAWEGNCPTLMVFSASIALPADRDRSLTAVFGRAWYVSAANGNDATADGTSALPYASIEAAVAAVNAAGDWPSVIFVDDGQYTLSYANPVKKADFSYDGSLTGFATILTNRVALRSLNGPAATGINCAKKGGYGGLLLGSMGVVVDGFAITNALANNWDYRGALAHVKQGHLKNCFLGKSLINNQGCTCIRLEAGWIADCVFTGSQPNMAGASNYGGPIVTTGGIVDSCVFSNNWHYAGIRFGGTLVRNCLFANNESSTKNDRTSGSGGALYNGGGAVVENCTFMDNCAGLQGGGVYGGAIVVNCAFGGNTVTQSANGPDFYGANLAYSLSAQATATDGNIVGTPTVSDNPGDYSPTGVSATRDKGLGLRWLNESARVDIAGNPRVVANPDIGAFEYVPTGDEFGVSVAASAYTGTDTLTVTFTATVVGPENVTYAWDFGDGATSTEASPTHAYAAPGYYTVSLTVTDAADATRTASFEGGEDLIKVLPSTCYVRKAGDSTPTAPYATPETAANNLYDAFVLSPAKIDVGEGDIPLGGPIAVSTALEIRGRGPGVTRLNANGKYIFLGHDGAVLADLTLRNRPGGNWNSGILMFGADALATNCVVREASGNSVALVGMTSGRLVECVVTGGESRNGGNGGIIILSDMTDNSTPQPISKRGGVVIDRCVVSNCTANYTGAVGGTGIRVLANHTPKPVIRNTLVAFNYAKTTGSDTANYGAGIYLSQPGVVENCTVVSNAFNKGDYAAGLYSSSAGLCVTNTVVWGNYAGETQRDVGSAAGTKFSHCLALEFATLSPSSYTIDACLSANPLFRDFDGGDWTSAAGSPLRNAGVAKPWMAGTRDLAGNPRKVERPDIGCYECPFKSSTLLRLK